VKLGALLDDGLTMESLFPTRLNMNSLETGLDQPLD